MIELFRKHRRTTIYLVASNLILYFGFRIWQAMFNNFAVEEIGIGAGSIGWIQSFREIPGLLGVMAGVLALVLSETRIMAFSVTMLGVGVLLMGQAETITFLLISTFLMSIGFHFFGPSSTSVLLMTAGKEQTPKILGQLRSLGAISALAATIAVYLFASRIGYRQLFTIVGVIVATGGLLLLPFSRSGDHLPQKRKIILRREYWLFYLLAFLMGSRRHIFTTFAIFLLVKNHQISVDTTATLFLINSIINTYALQAVGRMVSKVGERWILSAAFGTLIFIFLGYAFVDYLPVLFVFYIVDNVLFGFNLALTTYFQKIAVTPEEITSNLSFQQTINHIAAVIVPVAGGAIWVTYGAQAPFIAGAILVTVSLILVQFMRIKQPDSEISSPMSIAD
ncbi:MAG: MFS transporter [Chloroflexota bacterium]